jgi:hypothetical protein
LQRLLRTAQAGKPQRLLDKPLECGEHGGLVVTRNRCEPARAEPAGRSGVRALEKAKAEKESHGEFESECPGYCGAQDTFYVGTLKGVGRIYQQTFIDASVPRSVGGQHVLYAVAFLPAPPGGVSAAEGIG